MKAAIIVNALAANNCTTKNGQSGNIVNGTCTPKDNPVSVSVKCIGGKKGGTYDWPSECVKAGGSY